MKVNVNQDFSLGDIGIIVSSIQNKFEPDSNGSLFCDLLIDVVYNYLVETDRKDMFSDWVDVYHIKL